MAPAEILGPVWYVPAMPANPVSTEGLCVRGFPGRVRQNGAWPAVSSLFSMALKVLVVLILFLLRQFLIKSRFYLLFSEEGCQFHVCLFVCLFSYVRTTIKNSLKLTEQNFFDIHQLPLMTK